MEELKAPPFVTHVHIVDKWKPHLFLLISTKMNGLSMRAYAVRMSKLQAQSFFDCTTCYFRLFVRSFVQNILNWMVDRNGRKGRGRNGGYAVCILSILRKRVRV